MDKMPTGAYEFPALSEYSIVKQIHTIAFKDLAIGQDFWESTTRRHYRKTGEQSVAVYTEKGEYKSLVANLDMVVEL